MPNLYDLPPSRPPQSYQVQPGQPQTRQTQLPIQQSTEGSRGKSMGVAAFVLGIIGLISCLTGAGAFLGVVTAIIGLVLGSKARKLLPPNERGLATAGWVCSIIALCVCAAGVLFPRQPINPITVGWHFLIGFYLLHIPMVAKLEDLAYISSSNKRTPFIEGHRKLPLWMVDTLTYE